MFPDMDTEETPEEKLKRRLAGMRGSYWKLTDKEGNKVKIIRGLDPPNNLIGVRINGKKIADFEMYEPPSKVSGIEARGIKSQIDLQRLLTNYIDDPSRENQIALKQAYKIKGITLLEPQTNLFQKAQRFFGADIPYLIGIDKKGNYISIDEAGNETRYNPKKNKSSLSDKYGY
jgi:hypothetical protein